MGFWILFHKSNASKGFEQGVRWCDTFLRKLWPHLETQLINELGFVKYLEQLQVHAKEIKQSGSREMGDDVHSPGRRGLAWGGDQTGEGEKVGGLRK